MRRALAKIDLPNVQAFKDRHGKRRHYYRRRGHKPVRIEGEPGTALFAQSYQAAVAASKPSNAEPHEGPRSMGALIAEYYRSLDFARLKPTTQRGHKGLLQAFRKAHGHKSAQQLTYINVNYLLHGMADRPAQASNLRKRLITILDLAEDLGWIPKGSNPARHSRKVKYVAAGHPPWTDDDIAAFEKEWKAGTRERLALYLFLYTGQRVSDVCGMGRQHVDDLGVSVVQQKSGKRLKIKLHPKLAAEIALAPICTTFLMTAYDAPFTVKGLSNWISERARLAGLEGKTAHGLRKAAGRRLAEAGCAAHEIAAVLGHDSLAMVQHYTRDVDQQRLAAKGIDRLETKAGTDVSNPRVKLDRGH